MRLIDEEALELLDDLARYDSQYGDMRVPSRRGGVYEIDFINSLHAKLDQIFLRDKRQEAINQNATSSQHSSCEICGASHYTSECNFVIQETSSEQANAINNQYNTRTYGNPYSNTYNPGWRNHPNFSWSK